MDEKDRSYVNICLIVNIHFYSSKIKITRLFATPVEDIGAWLNPFRVTGCLYQAQLSFSII